MAKDTHERWWHIDAIFSKAMEVPAKERTAFLNVACAGDAELRREVESLLEAHAAADSFLENPVGWFDAPLQPSLSTDPGVGSRRNGQYVGPYRIDREIGRGGMGIVYKAEDLRLKRSVALKFLSPALMQSTEATKRFLREAQSVAALDHPNICTVYEVSQAEGVPFIVMAYVAGQTLSAIIKAGFLDPSQALDIIIQAAEGVQAAHERGIVHRDIKSSNLMVTAQGRVKVMDFGIAKQIGQTQMTKMGTTMGTLDYMSPEQVRGEPVDHRTDLWSLGAVFYELLIRQRPFRGDVAQAIMYAILNEDPEPLREVRASIPSTLEHIVQKALEKDLQARYQNAEDLLRDLKRAKEELVSFSRAETGTQEITEPKKERHSHRGLLWVSSAVLVLVLGVLGAYFWWGATAFLNEREGVSGNTVAAAANQDSVETSLETELEGPSAETPDNTFSQAETNPSNVPGEVSSQNGTKTQAPASQDERANPVIDAAAGDTTESPVDRIIESPNDLAFFLVTALAERAEVQQKAVLIAPFTFQTTQIASPFSNYFRRLLEEQVQSAAGWSLVRQAGVSAQAAGADHQVSGTYWERAQGIEFKAILRRLSDGRVVADAKTLVRRSVLEQTTYSIKPDNFDQALSDLHAFSKGEVASDALRIKVWTNKGDENLIFTDGEDVTMYVRVNTPAYVRFLYHLADGTRTLLLDSHYVEDVAQPYKIPQTFECDEPFGIEVLQAIAQTTPFDPVDVVNTDGYKVLRQDLRSFLANTRSAANRQGDQVEQAEDRVVITTIARQ